MGTGAILILSNALVLLLLYVIVKVIWQDYSYTRDDDRSRKTRGKAQ